MSIKSRKSPAICPPPGTVADATTLGLLLVTLPGLALAAQGQYCAA
jgi:hypothetical protein